jgi:hypothetical protein
VMDGGLGGLTLPLVAPSFCVLAAAKGRSADREVRVLRPETQVAHLLGHAQGAPSPLGRSTPMSRASKALHQVRGIGSSIGGAVERLPRHSPVEVMAQ